MTAGEILAFFLEALGHGGYNVGRQSASNKNKGQDLVFGPRPAALS